MKDAMDFVVASSFLMANTVASSLLVRWIFWSL